jgi:hypothetical protein
MLNDIIKKKITIKKNKKRFESTCQTSDLDHKTEITSYKVNWNKL